MGDSQQARRDSCAGHPSDPASVMGSPNSHRCFPAPEGEHTIPRWIKDLEGSFGGDVKLECERLENLLHRAGI